MPDADIHYSQPEQPRSPNHQIPCTPTQSVIGHDSAINGLKVTPKFIKGLRTAILDESNISGEATLSS